MLSDDTVPAPNTATDRLIPAEIERRRGRIIAEHGGWTAHNIRLSDDVYTMKPGIATIELRVRRCVQLAADLLRRPVHELRVLDLASCEGLFSIEFAAQGAQVLGLEARVSHLEKANFAREVLNLERLQFVQDDVRNLSRDLYGKFDVVLCAGIFYHLDTADLFPFLDKLAEVTAGLLILDTHISFTNEVLVEYKGRPYHGHYFQEHAAQATEAEKNDKVLASIDNAKSFWPTRSSLLNMLTDAGYTSVLECAIPVTYDTPDRVTMVAIKGQKQILRAVAPEVNNQPDILAETLPPREGMAHRKLLRRIVHRLRKLV